MDLFIYIDIKPFLKFRDFKPLIYDKLEIILQTSLTIDNLFLIKGNVKI